MSESIDCLSVTARNDPLTLPLLFPESHRRLVRLFTAVKRFQLIGTISAEILPDAVPVIMILFLIMYFFAAIGVHNYGGYITRDPSNRLSELVLDTDFSENDYWANNFNDMVR